MKIYLSGLILGAFLFSSGAQADIPYCEGTQVSPAKHSALQYVIARYAAQNGCTTQGHCILNFDQVKYSVAWSNAACGDGSTFICQRGLCWPLGYSQPSAEY